MRVELGKLFSQQIRHFPNQDRHKIQKFIKHVQIHGLENLTGRNKFSDNVPNDNPNWLERVKYAQQHNLWHYHIGIPTYKTASNGEQVSEYVLHYIRNDAQNFIKIVDMSDHPPLNLPSEKYLN